MSVPKGSKITLVGESGVGKTCIITSLVHGTFTENSFSTTGASYDEKIIHIEELNKDVLLEIWDTAGQEKLRSLTKIFYRDAVACILVYDISRKDSFEQMRDYWYDEVKKHSTPDTSKLANNYLILSF